MFSLILPFHSDVEKLNKTLDVIKTQIQSQGIQEVLLCHNGLPLTPDQMAKLKVHQFKEVKLLHTDSKGIGAGYKLGIENSTQEFVILSASDLPFGWTDLESFKKNQTDFAIGSKSHPHSVLVGVTCHRKLLSYGFYQLRRLILGRDTPGDSQGSFFVRTSLAKQLIKNCRFNNYLFSLELATRHLKGGGTVVEVPIQVVNNDGESSVSVMADSFQMFKDLVLLRRSIK